MTRLAWAVTTILVISGGCYRSRSETFVANVHTVVPGVLVRGGQPDAAGLKELHQSFGVNTVVNLNGKTARTEREDASKLGLNYLSLPMRAEALDVRQVMTFLRVMEEAAETGAVYVHCAHGMDRTGVAVAAYRVVALGWSADRAMAELRRCQAPLHQLAFPNIPPFVRAIGRRRETWSAALVRAVDRAAPAATQPIPLDQPDRRLIIAADQREP